MDYLFASRHKGLRFKSPGGYLSETGILLLALSRYIGDPNVIQSLASSPLTLIGPGEVKVDLADFDLKFQENLLSNLFFFKLPIPAETSSESF